MRSYLSANPDSSPVEEQNPEHIGTWDGRQAAVSCTLALCLELTAGDSTDNSLSLILVTRSTHEREEDKVLHSYLRGKHVC